MSTSSTKLRIMIKDLVLSLNSLNSTYLFASFRPHHDHSQSSSIHSVKASQIPGFHSTDRNITINPLCSSASPTKVTGG